MANINLGKVALSAGGIHTTTESYEKLDIVNYQGGSYLAKKNVPTGIAIENNEYWQLLAAKGEQGTNVGDLVIASSTQPTDPNTKVWIKEDSEEEYTVLTTDDIDDSAGEGDDNVVWSANKTYTQIDKKIIKYYHPNLGKGSLGNYGNANNIVAKYILKRDKASGVRITINKEPNEGYYYEWGYAEFDVEKGVAIANHPQYVGNTHKLYNATPFKNQVNVITRRFGKNAMGFIFDIKMTDGTNTISIQNDDYINAVTVELLYEEVYNYHYPVIENGTVANPGNENYINIGIIPTYNYNVCLNINIPLPTNSIYKISYRNSDNENLSGASETFLYTENSHVIILTRDKKYTGISIAVCDKDTRNAFTPMRVENVGIQAMSYYYTNCIVDYNQKADKMYYPYLSYRSLGNVGNADALSTEFIEPSHGAAGVVVTINKEPEEGYYWRWDYAEYDLEEGVCTTGDGRYVGNTHRIYNKEKYALGDNSFTRIFSEQCKGFAFCLWMTDGTNSISIQDPEYTEAVLVELLFDEDTKSDSEEIIRLVNNSRHINPIEYRNPVTLLHFSDIHGDSDALNRILKKTRKYKLLIDDMICTGDIVANEAETIESWWNSKIMTCMGNHDTANYDSSATPQYDWTALDMADRDAYYIAPFEDDWTDVIHTSGKSYYYKDYNEAKVRLIVLDGMLYMEQTTDTEDQNTWLTALLDDAITNGYHVLIAIHAPHGGAVPVTCGFTKYGQTVRPTTGDCNTPTSLINLVGSKIESGLTFIGYICGHAHQDTIWDANNDGKQLMYCVTCAATNYAPQWNNKDQNRNADNDAYNILTIDTYNHLFKIIRGGGADSDNYLRSRKCLVVDYSTGSVLVDR